MTPVKYTRNSTNGLTQRTMKPRSPSQERLRKEDLVSSETRRHFLRSLLGGCACSLPAISAAVQVLPPDNGFQVRLSHLHVQEGRQLKQILITNTPPVGSSATIEVLIGKRSEKFVLMRVRKISDQYYLPIMPVEQNETARFILKSDDGKTSETSLEVLPVRRWKVFLIHNSHADPGYLDLPSKVRARFVPFIDDAMKFCEETRDWPDDAQFRWNIEVSYLVEDYRKARDVERVRQVAQWIKKGRLAIGGLYCNTQTDFMSLETLHRTVYYATNRLTREFGIDCEGVILDDVPGFTWGLIEVMTKSGLRYLVMGSNGYRDNMQNGNAPILFYLAGPEGSEVLVWRPIHYGESYDLMTKRFDVQGGEQMIARYFDRYERSGYPFDAIALQVAADFAPPHKHLSEEVRTWNSLWAYPRLRISTIPEFFHYVEDRSKDLIPRLSGGAPDGWANIHIGEANMAALARQTEDYLPDVERLATLAQLVANGPARPDEFRDAYHRLIFWEEHTFEWPDIRSDIYVDEAQGGGKHHWEEKTDHVRCAHGAASRIEKESSPLLCRNIRTSGPLSLVVWNAVSWMRGEIVRTPVPHMVRQPFRLLEAQSGREIPYQIEKRTGAPDLLVFFAENIPALGYRTFHIEPGNATAGESAPTVAERALENQFYKLALLDKDGTAASLFDKELRREFVDPKAEHGFNKLVYRLHQQLTEREYKTLVEFPIQNVTFTKGATGAVYSSLKVSGQIEYICKFEHEIILYSSLKRIDFYNRITKKPVYPKESAYYAFPFAIPTDYHFYIDNLIHLNAYKIDVPGAIMQPDLDQIPGSARDYYVSQHWVSISRRDFGALWSSADAPVVQLGGIQTDKYLSWLTMQDDNWLARGWLYSLLMNNHWVTNVPIAQGGDYLFRYAVLTHGADWTYNDAHHFGWGFMSPLRAYLVEGPQPGEWSESSQSFMEIVPQNVYLAGFKASEDGDGVILRLYEGAGLGTNAAINFKLPQRQVKEALGCDARERNGATLTCDRDSVRIPLKPFETNTVRVRFS